GTTTKLSPSASLSISIESEGVVPVPGEATLYLPGSFLMMSIRAAIVDAGKFGLICQELGVAPAFVDEILVDVEGNLAIERRVHHDARRGEQDGVAIARRARGLAHAEIAASAGDVLDVELFAEFLRQFLRHQPSDDVGDASGREWHDDLDRLAGVLLGKSRARNHERHCERYDADEAPHLWSLSQSAVLIDVRVDPSSRVKYEAVAASSYTIPSRSPASRISLEAASRPFEARVCKHVGPRIRDGRPLSEQSVADLVKSYAERVEPFQNIVIPAASPRHRGSFINERHNLWSGDVGRCQTIDLKARIRKQIVDFAV